MKYNLDDLHWQEFEVLSFKILQILISQDVQFIEGGNDKGRDIVYEGKSAKYDNTYSGKWIFQVKHKSKLNTEAELTTTLDNDLKVELKKVFVTNGLKYDNYFLITNKVISGSLYDKLQDTFLKFKKSTKIKCKHFTILSYRHIESCIENNTILKWMYPNIINHADFLLLLKDALNYYLENRNRGWLTGLEKQRKKFVYTQFYQKAYDKLCEYPAIILSGPPKSGKTFNAQILALNFSVFKNYQPIIIDNPEEIESSFEFERNQIFICDDAFGKYALSYRAEDWFIKLDRIFELADQSHLFIFTSREYIFRAFVNFGNESAQSFLEKIIVESHNYLSQEKLAILKRYTLISKLSDYDKESILDSELILTKHKNFSPETIRAFFANIIESKKGKQLDELKSHLDKPDKYLSTIFFKLSNTQQAALLSVLCTVKNDEKSIFKTFDNICNDLKLNTILNSEIEFSELDDSILRILKTNKIEEINFYHPSMQEFLTRQLINNKSGKLKEVVLKNLNNDLLSLTILKSSIKSVLSTPEKNVIELHRTDLAKIKIGLNRLTYNEDVSLYQVAAIFNWFKSEYHILHLKIYDASFFKAAKEIVTQLIKNISSDEFYSSHNKESISSWSQLLFSIKNMSIVYGLEINKYDFVYFENILNEKSQNEFYWMIVFRVLNFAGDDFIRKSVGKDWLNNFFIELRKDIYELGYEVFGNDFPDFEHYEENKRNKIPVEKVKERPNRTWYPRFLKVKDRMDILKEIKGTSVGNAILERLSKPYNEIINLSQFAKNRHRFILLKGWWKE